MGRNNDGFSCAFIASKNQKINLFPFFFSFRYWHQVSGLALLVDKRAQRFRLYTNYRQRSLWTGKIGSQSQIPLSCKVWANYRCRSQTHCPTLLQTPISQCSRLRNCQWLGDWICSSELHSFEITRHWKMWHYWFGLENSFRTLLQP